MTGISEVIYFESSQRYFADYFVAWEIKHQS